MSETITLRNNEKFMIRPFEEADIEAIQTLNEAENWSNLVRKHEQTKAGFAGSNIAYVIIKESELIGYIRGMTDGHISMYIAELLIKNGEQGKGMGTLLMKYVHDLYPKTRMDLLGSSTSKTFYESNAYRPFYGFRKTHEEWGM